MICKKPYYILTYPYLPIFSLISSSLEVVAVAFKDLQSRPPTNRKRFRQKGCPSAPAAALSSQSLAYPTCLPTVVISSLPRPELPSALGTPACLRSSSLPIIIIPVLPTYICSYTVQQYDDNRNATLCTLKQTFLV